MTLLSPIYLTIVLFNQNPTIVLPREIITKKRAYLPKASLPNSLGIKSVAMKVIPEVTRVAAERVKVYPKSFLSTIRRSSAEVFLIR